MNRKEFGSLVSIENLTDRWSMFYHKVSWAAPVPQTIKQTERFIRNLQKAVAFIKGLDKPEKEPRKYCFMCGCDTTKPVLHSDGFHYHGSARCTKREWTDPDKGGKK